LCRAHECLRTASKDLQFLVATDPIKACWEPERAPAEILEATREETAEHVMEPSRRRLRPSARRLTRASTPVDAGSSHSHLGRAAGVRRRTQLTPAPGGQKSQPPRWHVSTNSGRRRESPRHPLTCRQRLPTRRPAHPLCARSAYAYMRIIALGSPSGYVDSGLGRTRFRC